MTSTLRYIRQIEKKVLQTKRAGIGRREAVGAALIPIRKSAQWWDLSQDERQKIFEESSHNIQKGDLPGVARHLHHCRDLGPTQPFDFLTWFEYALEHAEGFEQLVRELRETEEWDFVEREIDIRLSL